MTLPGSGRALIPLGITIRDLPPALAEDTLGDSGARSSVEALRAASRALVARIPEEIAALSNAVAAERPDALLVDITTLGGQTYAAAGGLPWASWAPMLLPIPSRGVPPFGPGLNPKSGPLGRIRDSILQRLIAHYWDDPLPQFNRMRQQQGLPTLEHTLDYMLDPPLLLNFTSPPFDDIRRDWPASVRQIGPGLWAPDAEPPAWLDEIDRPLALVTCSTEFQDDGLLAQAAMDALADSDFYTVVTAGAIDPSTFTIPPNARVESFLPHHLLLPRTAVVVSHGGMGITQKALAAGVPVCVVPFGRDQSEVARRVVTSEAGTRVSKKKLSPDRLRTAIEQARACRAGAARVATGFATAGGPLYGADLLEQHLFAASDRRPSPSGPSTVRIRSSISTPPTITPERTPPTITPERSSASDAPEAVTTTDS
ncbi:nucleotide disphospho-sugar-binding domain-containing protein [Nocardia altamirensis]|uniref:nucleotide disphospho-sugar-binding domain-containing protein n=1 Tax=Nocardia altamirensis TaxID=472158 RepID=UPI0008400E1C